MATVLVCLISAIGSSIIALCVLAWRLAYLRFLRWVVEKTGTSASLRDVAVAARALNENKSLVFEIRKQGPNDQAASTGHDYLAQRPADNPPSEIPAPPRKV